MAGIPVVASRVGGTDSMVEHGKTAREVALVRHDKGQIVKELLDVYNQTRK